MRGTKRHHAMSGETLTPKMFDREDVEDWKYHLAVQGYVVIKDLLSEEQKRKEFTLFNDMMKECCPGFDENDSSTWENKNMPGLFGKAIQGSSYNMAHSDWMWFLRLCPEFKYLFSKIHNTNDLCVSFDGFSLDWNVLNTSESWLHEDQALNLVPGLLSVQGVYNTVPVTESSRGFCCVPTSHLRARERQSRRSILPRKNYVPLDDITEQSNSVKLLVPDNSMILWNSFLLHANECGTFNSEKGWNRRSAYICMMPSILRSEKVREAKIEAYKNGYQGTHWPIFWVRKREPYPRNTKRLLRLHDCTIRFNIDNGIPNDRLSLF